jgi:multidrug efflux pump subunit AcrB
MNFLFGWFFRLFNRTLDLRTRGYAAVARRAVRVASSHSVYAGLALLGYFGFTKVPARLHPGAGPGLPVRQHPAADAASFERTYAAHRAADEDRAREQGVRDGIAIVGFSFLTGAASPTPRRCSSARPFEERAKHSEQSASALMGKLMGQFSQVQEAVALVFPPPPVRGIGTAGGFKMMVQDRTRRR